MGCDAGHPVLYRGVNSRMDTMRHWMTLCEGSKRKITPAEQYIMAVQAQGRCSNCTLEPWDTKTVHLAWLESDGQPLVPFLVSLADQLGVKLVLAVEVVDSDYGGKLVRYYEQHGFTIVGSDFDDDFDFLNMEPSEDLQGEVSMEREPHR